MIKIVIYHHLDLERAYCKQVCKLTDNTLVDGDFEMIDSDLVDMMAFRQYYKDTYTDPDNKPVVIFPTYTVNGDLQTTSFIDYPEIPLVFSGFVESLNWSGLPAPLTYSPNRLRPRVMVSGGESGLSDWFTGAALEFTEEAGYMYLDVNNGNAPVSSFAISNVIDLGGGVTKLVSGALGAIAAVGMLIHITGETGWQFNPNGKFTIQSVNSGSGFVTITHTLGTGSHTGTVIGKIHYMSGAISVAAAKISKIMRGRDCSPWEARYCARVTASNPSRDNTHGYGSIDVNAAIAYDDTIPDDPFDALGDIDTLAINVVDGVANFTHDEVLNAREFKLYDNGEVILSDTVLPGESFSRSWNPIKLGLRSYKLKAFRDSQESDYSNTVTTNITSLTDMPPDLRYPESVWADLEVYYLLGGSIKHSKIVNAFQTVTNPLSDNEGVIVTEYLLEDGSLINENRLYASRNDLFYTMRGQAYLNEIRYYVIDPFSPSPVDLCGMDFSGADFSDFDFTGKVLRNCTFDSATMPAEYQDEVGRLLVLSQVLYCDPLTVQWYNGEPIGEEMS